MSKEATESVLVQTAPSKSFLGHTNQLCMVVFSQDGKKFISSSYDQTIRLWDVENSQELKTFSGHTDWVKGVDISSDGELIASGSLDHTAKLWNSQTGKEIASFSDESIVQCVSISPNNQFLAFGTEAGSARLLDIASKKEVFCLGEHMTGVLTLCFSPDGKLIAGGTGKSIYVWQTQTGERLAHIESNKARVLYLRFLSDNKHFVSGSEDGMIRIFNLDTQKEVRHFNGYNNWLQNFGISPDGKYILGVYDSCTKEDKIQVSVRKWSIENENVFQDQHFLGHETTVALAAFSFDCCHLVTASTDKKIFLWNMKP